MMNEEPSTSHQVNEGALQNSHMISHMKFSYVKSLCGIGTIHI